MIEVLADGNPCLCLREPTEGLVWVLHETEELGKTREEEEEEERRRRRRKSCGAADTKIEPLKSKHASSSCRSHTSCGRPNEVTRTKLNFSAH